MPYHDKEYAKKYRKENKVWLQQYNTKIKKEKYICINLRIKEKQAEILEEYRKEKGMKKTDLIRYFIKKYLTTYAPDRCEYVMKIIDLTPTELDKFLIDEKIKLKERENSNLIKKLYNNICDKLQKANIIDNLRINIINEALNILTFDELEDVFELANKSNYLQSIDATIDDVLENKALNFLYTYSKINLDEETIIKSLDNQLKEVIKR